MYFHAELVLSPITFSSPIQNHADEFAGTVIMPKLARIGSPAFRRFVVDFAPIPTIKELRGIIDVLYKTSVEIFVSKKKAIEDGEGALASQLGKGKDIISILSGFLGCCILVLGL